MEQADSKDVRAQGQPGVQIGGCLHHEAAEAESEAESGCATNRLRLMKDHGFHAHYL
jgi:hypothetical protein